MNLQLPEWALAVAPSADWVPDVAGAGARERHGVLAEVALADAREDVQRSLTELDPDLLLVLAPVDASPGLLVGLVVEWSERLTAAASAQVVADVADGLGQEAVVDHVSTGLDEALVVRRERQLQAVIPERGTGRALVLTWSAFGDVGWAVHEQAFAAAVASASSSATVDLSAR